MLTIQNTRAAGIKRRETGALRRQKTPSGWGRNFGARTTINPNHASVATQRLQLTRLDGRIAHGQSP
jgi:hypothetical protein